MVWNSQIHGRDKWRALVDKVRKPLVPIKGADVLYYPDEVKK
jgi:hypothetical protein